jgi:hypothetical protein
MKIKRRSRLKIKRRVKKYEPNRKMPLDQFQAHRVCRTFSCSQPVYMSGEIYCYYCTKKRGGLII